MFKEIRDERAFNGILNQIIENIQVGIFILSVYCRMYAGAREHPPAVLYLAIVHEGIHYIAQHLVVRTIAGKDIKGGFHRGHWRRVYMETVKSGYKPLHGGYIFGEPFKFSPCPETVNIRVP